MFQFCFTAASSIATLQIHATPSILGNCRTSKSSDCCIDNSFMHLFMLQNLGNPHSLFYLQLSCGLCPPYYRWSRIKACALVWGPHLPLRWSYVRDVCTWAMISSNCCLRRQDGSPNLPFARLWHCTKDMMIIRADRTVPPPIKLEQCCVVQAISISIVPVA